MELTFFGVILGAVSVLYGQLAWVYHRLGKVEGELRRINGGRHGE